MEEKIALIKQIVKHHPSYGTDKGWSTYVGGMADTGYWYWEKLIEVDNKRLEVFLAFLQKEKEYQDKAMKDQFAEYDMVKSLSEEEQVKYHNERINKQYEAMQKFGSAIEFKLLWGK